MCGNKKEIKQVDSNERSEMCRILYPVRDTRDMMHTHAFLSHDGLQIVVEEPAVPSYLTTDSNSMDVFCKQMGIDDENEKKDWSTWALGVTTNRPTKRSVYHLPTKCNLDFNDGMKQPYELKPNYKFSLHKVPVDRQTTRKEQTPIIMWCLGIDGTREAFAPTADEEFDDFFNQISEGMADISIDEE